MHAPRPPCTVPRYARCATLGAHRGARDNGDPHVWGSRGHRCIPGLAQARRKGEADRRSPVEQQKVGAARAAKGEAALQMSSHSLLLFALTKTTP